MPAAPLPFPSQGSPRNGWKGKDHKVFLEDDCPQAGKVSWWYSQFLLWVSSADRSVSSLMQPSKTIPATHLTWQAHCSILCSLLTICSNLSTLLSITMLCVRWFEKAKPTALPQTPKSPLAYSISTEEVNTKLPKQWGRHCHAHGVHGLSSTALLNPALLFHCYYPVCSTNCNTQITRETRRCDPALPQHTVICIQGFLPTLTPPRHQA